MLEIDNPTVEAVLVAFIRDQVYKNGFESGIIGVSGGLDSAVVLALTRRALGAEHTFALLMPYRLSSPESLEHGRLICEQEGVSHQVIDITPMIDAYFTAHPSDNRLLLGNKCARERMSILYDHSVRRRALVVGTSNKSEILAGYSTLWGDSAAAFLPLGDLYKTQIFSFARHLGIPEPIIAKKPSADLWDGQTDEGELGITYREMDEILCHWVDQRLGVDEIIAAGYAPETVRRVQRLVQSSQYKRTMPPAAKLQGRTVGIDFRYLRDWGK